MPLSSSNVDRRIPEKLSTSRERNLTVVAPGWFALGRGCVMPFADLACQVLREAGDGAPLQVAKVPIAAARPLMPAKASVAGPCARRPAGRCCCTCPPFYGGCRIRWWASYSEQLSNVPPQMPTHQQHHRQHARQRFPNNSAATVRVSSFICAPGLPWPRSRGPGCTCSASRSHSG
jgi:hypothetical protein